jgi:hypothetical protein
MDTEQIMTRLLAEIRTNQTKTGVNLEEIRGDTEEMLAKMEIKQGRLEAKIE